MTIKDINIKDGFFIRNCGSGFCLVEKTDSLNIDIAYATTLRKLTNELNRWNCGIIL